MEEINTSETKTRQPEASLIYYNGDDQRPLFLWKCQLKIPYITLKELLIEVFLAYSRL